MNIPQQTIHQLNRILAVVRIRALDLAFDLSDAVINYAHGPEQQVEALAVLLP